VTEILLLVTKILVGALILSIGTGATFADVGYLLRRPGLLARSLLAMYVLVPLAAFALIKLLSVSASAKTALLVLAVSAGAPLLPRRLERYSGGEYAISIVVTTSLLAIVVVPLWVKLLAWHFDLAAEVSPFDVANTMAVAVFLPLAAGMVLRAVAPVPAERFADQASAICGITLVVVAMGLLATQWEVVLTAGWQGIAALVVLLLVALAIGHILGGPVAEHRTGLAIACATRHVGIALIVATLFRGPRTVAMLATYVIASLLVTIPYLQWRRYRGGSGPRPIGSA